MFKKDLIVVEDLDKDLRKHVIEFLHIICGQSLNLKREIAKDYDITGAKQAISIDLETRKEFWFKGDNMKNIVSYMENNNCFVVVDMLAIRGIFMSDNGVIYLYPITKDIDMYSKAMFRELNKSV